MPSMKPYLKRPLPPAVRRKRAARVSAALSANPGTPAKLIAERDRFHRQMVSVGGKPGDYVVLFKGGFRRFSNRAASEKAMLAAIRRGDKPTLFLAVKLPRAAGQRGGEAIWTYPSLLNAKMRVAAPNPKPTWRLIESDEQHRETVIATGYRSEQQALDDAAKYRKLYKGAHGYRVEQEEPRHNPFSRSRIADPREFHKKSFRTITPGSGKHKLVVGCPTAHSYRGGRCGGSMEVQSVMTQVNPSPAAQARPIVQEVLRMHGLSNKFSIRRVGFSDLLRHDVYVVAIQDWKRGQPELSMRVKVFILEKLSVLKTPNPEDRWVVEFHGPGILGNPRRNVAFAEPSEAETVGEFKVFPPRGGMIATDTYETGVNWPPFQYVEAYARKGKFGLIAFGAYNAFGLIGPEQGGVALVAEKPSNRVIGTITIPYSRKKRLAMFKQIFSEVNWPWAAKNAGFEMRYMPNPEHRVPTSSPAQGRGKWGKRRAPDCTCDAFHTCKSCLRAAPPPLPGYRPNPGMGVHREMFERWKKYVRLLLAERGAKPSDVRTPVMAWNIAHKLDIPKEAYHVGLNDRHIETALRRIFPAAWPPRNNPGIDPVAGAYRAIPRPKQPALLAKSKAMKKCRLCGEPVAGATICFRCQHPEVKRPRGNPEHYGTSGRTALRMTLKQALSIPRSGPADEAVAALVRSPSIARQLAKISPAALRDELRGYGAWDDAELTDHGANLRRWTWLVGADIAEEYRVSKRNPGPAYHKREQRRYAKLLRGDLKAGHRDAADYWQGALSAEAASVAAGGVVRNPMTKKREEWQRRFTRLLMKALPQTSSWPPDLKQIFRRADKLYMEGFSPSKAVEIEIRGRLEYLRGEIEAERISYGEIHELQSLAKYIEPGDVQLLEWAGVPESKAKRNPLRYSVVQHPHKKGFAIHDSVPRYSEGEDVEGVGWVPWRPPRRLPPTFGWFKFKRDAIEHADMLNRARSNPLTWFHVYLGNKLIDAIPVGGKTSAEEVRRGLVEHDGYNPRIRVVKTRVAVKKNWTAAHHAKQAKVLTAGASYLDARGEEGMARAYDAMAVAHEQSTKRAPKGLRRNPLLMVVPNPRKKAKAKPAAKKGKKKWTEVAKSMTIPALASLALKGAVTTGAGMGLKAAAAAAGVAANPSCDMGTLMKNPRFAQAVKLYRKFHGCDPKSVKRVLIPIGDKKRIDGREFFVSLGKAPSEAYDPPSHSGKAGSIFVHPYERKPEKVVSADGKTIVTLPGSHRVTDWIRG